MDHDDSPDAPPDAPDPGTLPVAVPLRARHDGWTPERQHDFISALAETGCVIEASAAVGMNARSAYKLKARAEANVFRQAWDIALEYAIRNLSDAAMSRVIYGVTRPVFYKGVQIGERRYFDERLTQFMLRYRDPVRYGAWRDSYEARRHPDGPAIILTNALNALMDQGHGIDPPTDRDGVELPLAEGPQPEAEIPPDDDLKYPDDDPELRELRQAFRTAFKPTEELDEEQADWRDPLTTLRPNRKSKFKSP